jgi:hypothetical protein
MKRIILIAALLSSPAIAQQYPQGSTEYNNQWQAEQARRQAEFSQREYQQRQLDMQRQQLQEQQRHNSQMERQQFYQGILESNRRNNELLWGRPQ